jgi:hypothetical protein
MKGKVKEPREVFQVKKVNPYSQLTSRSDLGMVAGIIDYEVAIANRLK